MASGGLAKHLLRWLQTRFSATQGRMNGSSRRYLTSLLTAATGGGVIYAVNAWVKHSQLDILPVVHARNELPQEAESKAKKVEVPFREARFLHFASVEYEGVVYMTPHDFLESITEEAPRPRIGRHKLSRQQLESWHRNTPQLSKGNSRLFRGLHDQGIISYTEYLFLLCVLTMNADPPKKKGVKSDEPHSGFRIAFNMFDTDGNQIVDKKEFLVGMDKELADTTLLVHFFGSQGDQVLNYKDFHTFMSNLQREVIELEFMEFSKGMITISEVDFAKILLRYTSLDRGQIDDCLERVRRNIPEVKGISLEDFSQFCQFLNSLDDFALTMKMYTYAQQSVSQEDFQRAVRVCTGFKLARHVVNAVFQIFDSDGDGNLSHHEFISVMKDRLHRGDRSHLMHIQTSWDSFRSCVRNEMRSL